MKHRLAILAILIAVISAIGPLALGQTERDWTHFVRIGAYGLKGDNVEAIVRDATASNVFGIEVDNDITGRYESFLDPTEKLSEIRAVADRAHRAGNKAFVYIAGTECITANADKAAHTLAKDHPDWLQRKATGEPAIFNAGAAFWIAPGDEDVWISPYAMDWRKQYMERVRQIAATGIDGIYVDIPYWMTHFEGWEQTWASFDDYTVQEFRKRTGLNARRDVKIGDFSDPNFRKWVDFRIDTITAFMREIDQNAKAVNPQIRTIPEIYPGIEEAAVRVGADVYELYPVVDAIAHEYEYGEGDHTASARTALDWFFYQIGMHSFRAFGQGKATWVLNYSWDGDKNIVAREAMLNLAMSQIMAGVNMWDAKGHSMSGSNDIATRTQIFDWVRRHESEFYSPRTPLAPVGVYFSPKSRDYFAEDFIASFRGIMMLLMQKHWAFQVVTPRTMKDFRGPTLVLPDVRVLSDEEARSLRAYAERGGSLVATGKEAIPALGTKVVRFSECPGKAYINSLTRDSESTKPGPEQQPFFEALHYSPRLEVQASPSIATSITTVNGAPHIYFANFSGLKGGKNATPVPEMNVQIRLKNASAGVLHLLPFMGDESRMLGVQRGNDLVFTIPRIERGAVAWIEQAR